MPSFRRATVMRLASSLCVLTLLLAGCDLGAAVRAAREKAERQAREQERQEARATTAAAFAAVTEDEALRLAEKIESALAAGDASGLSGEFDLDAFGSLILQQPGYESLNADAFRNSAKREGITGDQMIQRLVGETAAQPIPGGSYVRLRVRELDGRKTALFRMLSEDGRYNYHEYAFARGQDGRVRIADVYVYAAGEWLSQGIGRVIIAAVGPMDQRMSQAEFDAGAAQIRILKEARSLVDSGDSRQFDKIVATLTPEMQREKWVIVMQAAAANGQSRRRIAHADRLAELYPNDPATLVMCSDCYLAAKRYDEALAMVEQLDALVGGDPFLSVYRGEILFELDRLPEARAVAFAAHQALPEFDRPYATLANVAVQEREFEEAAAWLHDLAVMRQVSAKAARDYACRKYSDPAWKEFRDSVAWRKLAKE